MNTIALLKLGGSLITDKSKPLTARPRVIRRLAREIKAALSRRKNLQIILAHGSGSFGHVPATRYATAEGFKDDLGRMGACITHDVAAQINRIVVKELLGVGLPAVSVPPSTIFTGFAGKPSGKFLEPVLILLKNRIIPVLYGDVIWDRKQGSAVFSGETSLKIVAEELVKIGWKVDRDIQCGVEDGVRGKNGRVIPRITEKNFPRLRKYLSSSASTDVTGGMLHKVKESLALARLGVRTLITGGARGRLQRALTGNDVAGTLIA